MVSLSRQRIDYVGWWTTDELRPLGLRAALDSTRSQFLQRCGDVYKLTEGHLLSGQKLALSGVKNGDREMLEEALIHLQKAM